jgi:hypothetical protein
VNKEKECTTSPCHASWADIQTVESRECFSVKDNDNGEGTDKVLRIEKDQSDNYPQKESSDPGEPTGSGLNNWFHKRVLRERDVRQAHRIKEALEQPNYKIQRVHNVQSQG